MFFKMLVKRSKRTRLQDVSILVFLLVALSPDVFGKIKNGTRASLRTCHHFCCCVCLFDQNELCVCVCMFIWSVAKGVDIARC